MAFMDTSKCLQIIIIFFSVDSFDTYFFLRDVLGGREMELHWAVQNGKRETTEGKSSGSLYFG